MNVWSWVFLLIIIVGGLSIVRRSGLSRAVKSFESISNRYIYLMLLLLFLATFFGNISQANRNNWLYLPALVAIEIFSYCTAAWSLIHNADKLKPANLQPVRTNRLILRPRAAALIIVTFLLQGLAFYLAGPEVFNSKWMGNVDETVANFWLWAAAIIGGTYIVGCNLVFLSESTRGLRSCNNTNRTWFKYNSYSFTLISLMGLAYFGSSLIGIFFYGLFGWRDFMIACSQVEKIMSGAFILAIGSFALLSPKLLVWYEKLDRKLLKAINRKLQGLYELTLEIFPAKHHVNAYSFALDQADGAPNISMLHPPNWVLDSVITQLTVVRNKFWRAEALRKAEAGGEPADHFLKTKPVSIKAEADLWFYYLHDQANSKLTKELSRRTKPTGAVIPPLRVEGIEQIARYYIKLSKEIDKRRQKQLKGTINQSMSAGVFNE